MEFVYFSEAEEIVEQTVSRAVKHSEHDNLVRNFLGVELRLTVDAKMISACRTFREEIYLRACRSREQIKRGFAR